MSCWSKWDVGGCGCSAPCGCPVPATIYITDSSTTIALSYHAAMPAWVASTLFLASGPGWVGCYGLAAEVATGCADPPYPAAYAGHTPIRYVATVDADCNIAVYRVWGDTNIVASGTALIDCALNTDCSVTSAACGGTCRANWQEDRGSAALDDCAPLPVSMTLALASGSPLAAGIVIND